jgi:replicative DNA helicase
MSNAKFVTASDAMGDWRDNVLSGKPPRFFRVGDGELSRIEVAPKQITLVGGAPGAGKTAFTMQCVIDALRLTPTLRAVVCNIEMSADVLLDRQLARLSGVSLETIRYRRIAAHQADRIDAAMNSLDELGERLCFVRPPFDLGNVAATADEFAPLTTGNDLLIVLDYIQRIAPPGVHGDKRGSIDASMNYLRQFADAGAALLVIASVGRTKDSRGRSSYDSDSLDLASFKESGELEFGADDAFILAPCKKTKGVRTLKHLKSRHGECRDLHLRFDGARQSFEPCAATETSEQQGGLSSALSELWERTKPSGGREWKP